MEKMKFHLDLTATYWIGLQRCDSSGDWEWIDKTPLGPHLPDITTQTNTSYKCSMINWDPSSRKNFYDQYKSLDHSAE